MNLTNFKNLKISSATIFFMVCCLLVVMKIVLVSGEEILARNQPHDDLWHILAAARGYWLGDNYTNMAFIHLPVYSLWVAIVYFTGVPLRIATELFFLVSGFLFVLSLSRTGINRFLCTVSYGLIIFNPLSFQLFNYSLAETLYAPIFLMALTAMIMMWINRGQKTCPIYAILSGVFFSLLWNLRKENLLILGLMLLLAFIAFIVLRKEGHNWRSIFHQIAIMIFVPFVIIWIVSLTVQTINYKKFGLFVSTETSAPGYATAYKALLRIKPPDSIRFIPVPKDVRRAAYAVSPAFKELEPYFEGEFGYAAASETRKHMRIQGEIAAGWFYWALRDAAALAGHHVSAVKADAYYQRIADEINAAIDSGRLQGRFVFMTFLDPEVTNYLPYLPDSFLKMWRLFTSSKQLPREKEAVDLNPAVRNAFDTVANRRTALTGDEVVKLQGWVFQENDPIKRVLLRSAKGDTLGACEVLMPRPDVAKSYTAQGDVHVPANTGFTLTAAHAGQQLGDAQLVFINGTKHEFAVPYKGFVIGKPIQLVTPDAKQRITCVLDSSSAPKTLTFRNSAQSFIWTGYGKLVAVFTYIGIAALLVILFSYRSINFKENIYPIMFLLLFAVLTRISMFALIDASSWPGDQPRYLFPVMPVYSCFLLMLIAQAFSVIKMRYEHKINHGC